MKKIIFAVSFFVFYSLQTKATQSREEHENNIKALLFECIQGNNNSCEKFINSSKQAKRKFQELKRKQWIKDELQGKHIFKKYLNVKKTNHGNKQLIKQIMLHMEYTKMLKGLGKKRS